MKDFDFSRENNTLNILNNQQNLGTKYFTSVNFVNNMQKLEQIKTN